MKSKKIKSVVFATAFIAIFAFASMSNSSATFFTKRYYEIKFEDCDSHVTLPAFYLNRDGCYYSKFKVTFYYYQLDVEEIQGTVVYSSQWVYNEGNVKGDFDDGNDMAAIKVELYNYDFGYLTYDQDNSNYFHQNDDDEWRVVNSWVVDVDGGAEYQKAYGDDDTDLAYVQFSASWHWVTYSSCLWGRCIT